MYQEKFGCRHSSASYIFQNRRQQQQQSGDGASVAGLDVNHLGVIAQQWGESVLHDPADPGIGKVAT